MVDKAEVDNGTREIQALKEEISKQTAEQIKAEFLRMSLKAGELKTQIDNKLATEHKAPDKFEGEAAKKAVDIKKEIRKILLAGKTTDKSPTPEGKSQEITELAKIIIEKISVELDPEKMEIDENSSPYLYSFLSKVIEGKVTSIDSLQEEFKKLNYLRGVNESVYDKVHDALIEVAKKRGLTEEQAKNKFRVEGTKTESEKEDAKKRAIDREESLIDENGDAYKELEARTFLSDWQTYYIHYFDQEDYSLVKSFYNPEEFVDYISKLKSTVEQEMKMKGQGYVLEDVGKEVSERLIAQVTSLYGKLYTKLDLDNPKEFFEEIERQDFFKGIEVTQVSLKRGINGIERYMERHEKEVSDKLGGMEFWKRAEEKPIIEDIITEDVTKKNKANKTKHRLAPTIGEKKIDNRDFIEYIRLVTDTYRDARRYTHNARALFYHPADPEKGFYSQLSKYAEELRMVDLEQMMLLPDNVLFQQAFDLYDKSLDEQFAFQDWRHTATMFTPEVGSKLTRLENQVLENLKLIYKEKLDNHDMSEGRLRAALSMAVGASRGIFMNEVEKAGLAEPHLTEDGKATFASYYTTDATALVAFNPMHQFFRWQTERTLNPILFTPIEGSESVFAGAWDHNKLWKKMQQYRDSFVKGRKELGGDTLFADSLVNIIRAGGPLQRKGWRTAYQLEALFQYDDNKGTVNNLKTWKSLENIGYELLSDFVLDRIDPKFLKLNENKQNRTKFFDYIFDKYFEKKTGLEDYLVGIRSEAKKIVLKDITEGKRFVVNKSNITEEIELVTSQLFLCRALSRVIAQRIPTKFLRIDRDRASVDGVSRWKKVKQELGWSSEKFDSHMKDMLLAETLLRTEVSGKMKEILKKQSVKNMMELGGDKIEYKLSETKIKDLLKGKISEERIKEALAVYDKINTTYGFGQQDEKFLNEFANTIRTKGYKFTFAVEETDISLIPFRGAGNRVLPRLISDISLMEQNLIGGIIKLPDVLREVSMSGKGDLTPILEIMDKGRDALSKVHGEEYAYRTMENIAAVVISYFKKDTMAIPFFGIMGTGKRNSVAAEVAGRSSAVWEWDARDIDRFCNALETHRILPKKPYDTSKSTYDMVHSYIKLPFIKNSIKLPKIFDQRKPDYPWFSGRLRYEFGASGGHMLIESVSNLLPIVLLFLLWKYISEASKDLEDKKR